MSIYWRNIIWLPGPTMDLVRKLWRKLTHTKALEQSSGKLETDFFESVYRIIYITGQSVYDDTIGYRLYIIFVCLLVYGMVIGEIWHGYTEANLDDVTAAMNVVVIQSIALLRNISRVINRRFYHELAGSMESPYFDISTEQRKKLLETWIKTNKRYLKLLLYIGNSALAFWFTFPLLDDVEYNLATVTRLPFFYKSPVRYPFTYIAVVIALAYSAYFVMNMDMVMQTHLIHFICQFSILADCFKNIIHDCKDGFEGLTDDDLMRNEQFAERYIKRLGDLIEQHKRILSHLKKLKSILSGPMMAQLAASFILICFIGYQTATNLDQTVAKSLMNILYLLYNGFSLYVICLWCEEIATWSTKIGEAVYFSGWECGVYRFRGVRSSLLIVMARANQPVVITAGGMYNLSIASYASLVKGSYSALTFLLRFNHD